MSSMVTTITIGKVHKNPNPTSSVTLKLPELSLHPHVRMVYWSPRACLHFCIRSNAVDHLVWYRTINQLHCMPPLLHVPVRKHPRKVRWWISHGTRVPTSSECIHLSYCTWWWKGNRNRYKNCSLLSPPFEFAIALGYFSEAVIEDPWNKLRRMVPIDRFWYVKRWQIVSSHQPK